MPARIHLSQLDLIRPNYVVGGIAGLDPGQLSDLNINAILFDYDNTIAGFGEQPRSPQLNALRRLGRAGLNLFVVTNAHTNRSSTVKRLMETVISPTSIITPESCADSRIGSVIAEKPSPSMINYALNEFSLVDEATLLVGDRIFNDILAGNLAGVKTALVPPLGEEHVAVEKIQRPVETLVRRLLNLPINHTDFPPEIEGTRRSI